MFDAIVDSRARARAGGWEPHGDGVRVETDRGAYEAGRLVVAAGAWAGTLVPELHALAEPERQVLARLQPSEPELFAAEGSRSRRLAWAGSTAERSASRGSGARG